MSFWKKIEIAFVFVMVFGEGHAQQLDYTFDAEIPLSWYNANSKHTGEIDAYPHMKFYNVWFDKEVSDGRHTGAVVLSYAQRATEKSIVDVSLSSLSSFSFRGVIPSGKRMNVVVYSNGVPTLKRLQSQNGQGMEYEQSFNYDDATKVTLTNDSGEEFDMLRLTANRSSSSDIHSVESGEGEGACSLYTLQGRMIGAFSSISECCTDKLPKGVYIAVWNSRVIRKTKKILVR